MKKKRLAATLGAMALTAIIAVGGTLAYLSHVTETKKNVFTSSKDVSADLTEEKFDKNVAEKYTPGQVIAKNPVMTNDSKDNQSIWTAVKLEFVDQNGANTTYDNFKDYAQYQTGNVLDTVGSGWIKIKSAADGSELWVYNTLLASGSKTPAIFDSVKVNAGIKEVITDTTVTYYTYDENKNLIAVTPGEMTSEKTYYDKDGNKLDAFELPTFEIRVTGYAIQGSDVTFDLAKTELAKLAGIS